MSLADRLRPPPEERLSAPVKCVDLTAATAALHAEPHAAINGHRQIVVFRHGLVTLVSYAFDPGGILREHQADGVVTILVLAGHLRVSAEGEQYELDRGQLVGLAPNVPHTVEATVASEMLLTVSLITAHATAAA